MEAERFLGFKSEAFREEMMDRHGKLSGRGDLSFRSLNVKELQEPTVVRGRSCNNATYPVEVVEGEE